jgi:hypothetical protein
MIKVEYDKESRSEIQVNSVPESSVNIESLSFNEDSSITSFRSAIIETKSNIFEGGKK